MSFKWQPLPDRRNGLPAFVVGGDCLKVMGDMSDASVDLIVTDPPYEILDMSAYFTEMVRLLKTSGSIYVFGDKDVVAEHWYRQMKIAHKTLLVWHYTNSPKPRGRWRGSMQSIIYGYKSKSSVFHEDAARVPYLPATKKLHGRMRPSNGRMAQAMTYDVSKGALPRDVILCPALLGHLSSERFGHPDQKPIELIKKLVATSSNPGDLVFDGFAGTGTILDAAHQLGRSVLVVEKDPKWLPTIRARLNG